MTDVSLTDRSLVLQLKVITNLGSAIVERSPVSCGRDAPDKIYRGG